MYVADWLSILFLIRSSPKVYNPLKIAAISERWQMSSSFHRSYERKARCWNGLLRLGVYRENSSMHLIVQNSWRTNNNNQQKGACWEQGFYESFGTFCLSIQVGRKSSDGQWSGLTERLAASPYAVPLYLLYQPGFWDRRSQAPRRDSILSNRFSQAVVICQPEVLHTIWYSTRECHSCVWFLESSSHSYLSFVYSSALGAHFPYHAVAISQCYINKIWRIAFPTSLSRAWIVAGQCNLPSHD